MGRQGGGSLRSRASSSLAVASRGYSPFPADAPAQGSSPGRSLGELPTRLTVDEEIGQASRARANEGANLLAVQFSERLRSAGQVPRWHVILTWDDSKAGGWMDEERLAGLWAWLVRGVNLYVANGRKDCKHRYGHSFFGYLAGPDYGRRLGRLHWHAVTTDLPYVELERIWWRWGSSKVRAISVDEGRAQVEYVAREAVKAGDPRMWIPRKVFDWRAELALTGRRAPKPSGLPGRVADVAGTGEGAPAWWVDL